MQYVTSIRENTNSDTVNNRSYTDDEFIFYFRPALFVANDSFQLSNHVPNPSAALYEKIINISKLIGRLNKTVIPNNVHQHVQTEHLCTGFFIDEEYFVFPLSIYEKIQQSNEWNLCSVNFSHTGQDPQYTVKFATKPKVLVDGHLMYCQVALSSAIQPMFKEKVVMQVANLLDQELSTFMSHDKQELENQLEPWWYYCIGYPSLEDYSIDDARRSVYKQYYLNQEVKYSKTIKCGKYLSPGKKSAHNNNNTVKASNSTLAITTFTTDCFVQNCGSPIFNHVSLLW